jgi:2-succinyl-5-enolpyruvyl-6-hydroxy-3-cyclohexene-1-carboxylate synthase
MKYRIIETLDGQFYPQIKPSWLQSWRFLVSNADTSEWMIRRAMETFDPEQAAHFNLESDAMTFIMRVKDKTQRFWNERAARAKREARDIPIKRSIKIE